MVEPRPPAPYETSDVRPKWLVVAAAVIVVGMAAGLGLSAWVLRAARPAPERPIDVGLQAPPVPAPRLQIDPRRDLRQLREEKLERLSSSGWIDREAGVAHIPIDEAMRHVAEQGLPSWEPPDLDTPAVRAHRAREAALGGDD